nr:unnamed protein product [Callosobruchus analis]
MFEIATVNCSI